MCRILFQQESFSIYAAIGIKKRIHQKYPPQNHLFYQQIQFISIQSAGGNATLALMTCPCWLKEGVIQGVCVRSSIQIARLSCSLLALSETQTEQFVFAVVLLPSWMAVDTGKEANFCLL